MESRPKASRVMQAHFAGIFGYGIMEYGENHWFSQGVARIAGIFLDHWSVYGLIIFIVLLTIVYGCSSQGDGNNLITPTSSTEEEEGSRFGIKESASEIKDKHEPTQATATNASIKGKASGIEKETTTSQDKMEVPLSALVRSSEVQSISALTVSLGFSTFIGTPSAGGTAPQQSREVAFDSQGNIVLVGHGNFQPSGYPGVTVKTFGTFNDGDGIIVAKLTSDGSQLLWVTFVGGNGFEKGGYGLDLDGQDNIYVAGTTFSSNFPTTNGSWDESYNGNIDAYLFKLSPNGQTLIYSTYLGGSNLDTARGGLAVDGQGYAYVVGSSMSSDYLDEGGIKNPAKVNERIGGESDGFVTKVSQDGSSIIWSRFVGGTDDTAPTDGENIFGSQVDSQGAVYLNMIVLSSDAFTTPNAFDRTFNGESDTYFAKLSSDGQQVLYATYLGGSGYEFTEHRMALDGNGKVYLVGSTGSSDFPIVNGEQSQYGGGSDGYLTIFDSSGQLEYSTYIGGSGWDLPQGPAVDSSGVIIVTGGTDSADFTVTSDALDSSHNGKTDLFLRIYDPSRQLMYSTFYGGSDDEGARFVTTNDNGDLILVVFTQSSNFPTTQEAYDRSHNGSQDTAVLKFSMTTALTYTLTVNVVGNGQVEQEPDKPFYNSGEVVQLTATADPGWIFAGWSGDLSGSVNPGNLTMTDDKTVTATFIDLSNLNNHLFLPFVLTN